MLDNDDSCVMNYQEFLDKYAPQVPFIQKPSLSSNANIIIDKPIKKKKMSNEHKKQFTFPLSDISIHDRLVDEISERINIILTALKISQAEISTKTGIIQIPGI